jgi:hypothetical protein
MVVQTDDRRASAEELSAEFRPNLTADELLDTPFPLIGTVGEMADQLVRHRDRYGSRTSLLTSRTLRCSRP